MTPLEIAAKAAWNLNHPSSKPWEDVPELIRTGKIREQAAALRALVECEDSILPDVSEGAATNSPFPDVFAKMRKDIFKRICHAITTKA